MKRRQELLQRARELFSKKGFHSLTVSDITSSLGIARGTFYLYFENKENIYEEVLKEVVAEVSSRLKVLPTREPLKQLEENLKGVLSLFREKPETAKLIFYHPYKLNPKFDEIIEEFFKELLSLVESSLLKGIEMGIVRKCRVEVVSRAILGAFLQLGKEVAQGREFKPEEVARELLELALHGLLVEER
ncbi:TetR/AcrR family transcriptional regulator [Thermovibrio sp.]